MYTHVQRCSAVAAAVQFKCCVYKSSCATAPTADPLCFHGSFLPVEGEVGACRRGLELIWIGGAI